MLYSVRSMSFIGLLSFFFIVGMSTPAMSEGNGPADGFGLHVQAHTHDG